MRLIDADALLKRKGDCYDINGHLLYAVGTGDIMCTPTVEAEPVRHGHWERKRIMGKFYDECSVCQGDVESDPIKYPYCPNCGAKMEVEE